MRMNKLISPIIISGLLLVSMANIGYAKPISVKGNLKNTGESKYMYLFNYFGTEIYKSDSVENKAGVFEFKLKDIARGLYKIGTTTENSIILILGNENVSIQGDLSKPDAIKVSGSKENDVFAQYRSYNERYSQDVQTLQKDAQMLTPLKSSNPAKFEFEMNRLQNRLDSLNNAQAKFYENTIAENKGLYISKIISMFVADPRETAENFFKPEYFTDPELVRGDMLHSRISGYLQRFAQPNLESWKTSFNYMFSIAPEKSPGREVLYISIVKLVSPYDADYAKKTAEKYFSEYPKSEHAKNMFASLPKGKPDVGDMAPDFKLTHPDGKTVSLSSLKGKIVLLDFWASWCGPCRMENPNVVKAYNRFKDKGFTVFNVSLDNNKDNWIAAIKKDKLDWDNHGSDLKGWQSPVAALYHVKGIPSTFLIDKDGKIIATNLRGQSLEDMLEKICK